MLYGGIRLSFEAELAPYKLWVVMCPDSFVGAGAV